MTETIYLYCEECGNTLPLGHKRTNCDSCSTFEEVHGFPPSLDEWSWLTIEQKLEALKNEIQD